MSLSFTTKKIVSSYMLISILFFGYNMLQLPKMPYFAIRFILMLIVAVYALSIIGRNFKNNLGIRLFLGYFLYLVFSFIFIFIYDYPVSLITDAVLSGLFPMLFFLVGVEDKNVPLFENRFYRYYFWGTIFLFICSIYLFVTMPSWYMSWKISMLPDEWQENPRVLGAMSGFSGSGYLVGYSALFSFCYLLFRIKFKTTKKYDYILLFVVVFCLIFSQVRVAILAAVIVLLWYIFTTLNLKNFFLLMAAGILLVAVFSYIVTNSETLSTLFDFFTSKVEGASEDTRYETGLALLSKQTNFIFGHGYGSGGHEADTLGLPSVTDFEYVKLFYETGIIGFVMFIAIIFKVFSRKPRISFELFIIMFYLIAMFIANPLTADATMSPVFWYAVGRRLA